MRLFIFLTVLFFSHSAFSQDNDSLAQNESHENILNATSKSRAIHVDLENNHNVELLLKKIHTYKFLESIELEGEVDEAILKKIIYRLSAVKNLTSITLRENFLQKAPENLNTLKSLKSVTVIGNKDLSYDDLFSKLSQTNITSIDLTDNDFKKVPSGISSVKTLTKVKISGSDQLDYEQLMDKLAELPTLNELAIPVNFITELPKNIVKLKSLQLLDVSDNVLTEIPENVSALKSINNLSIYGNLFLNPVKELEKFKGADIRYISMDKEISGDEVEALKKIFPQAEINFPVLNESHEETPGPVMNVQPTTTPAKEEVTTGTLVVRKDFKILSSAYIAYQAIFQNSNYNFDTLGFNERYANLRYTNVYRRLPDNRSVGGTIGVYMSAFPNLKYREKYFYFTNYRSLFPNYPELNAFSGMNWVYKGELSRKKFRKKFTEKTWSDIRIVFDNNNSVFTIQLKSPEGFENIKAYPVPANFNHKQLELVQKTYVRRYSNYQKAINRRADRFNQELKKNKAKYDSDYYKSQELLWNELQLRMSNTEKLMSREQWLQYYDNIIANEKEALNKSPLSTTYLLRSLNIRGYNSFASFLPFQNNNYQAKNINVNFVDQNTGSTLPVANAIVVDCKNKCTSVTQGSLGINPEPLLIKQFSSYVIFVELRNGNMGVVVASEIDKLKITGTQTYSLKTIVLNKNLDDIGICLKQASIE